MKSRARTDLVPQKNKVALKSCRLESSMGQKGIKTEQDSQARKDGLMLKERATFGELAPQRRNLLMPTKDDKNFDALCIVSILDVSRTGLK